MAEKYLCRFNASDPDLQSGKSGLIVFINVFPDIMTGKKKAGWFPIRPFKWLILVNILHGIVNIKLTRRCYKTGNSGLLLKGIIIDDDKSAIFIPE